MDMPSLKKEAAHCRSISVEYAGRPEESFLLQLASAMEELALIRSRVDVIAADSVRRGRLDGECAASR